MSYSGYEEYLCEEGHYWAEEALQWDEEDSSCPFCNKKAVWMNSVDCTNSDGEEFAAKLEVKTERENCTCSCGNVHCKIPATYYIPQDQGRKIEKL